MVENQDMINIESDSAEIRFGRPNCLSLTENDSQNVVKVGSWRWDPEPEKNEFELRINKSNHLV